MPRRSRALFPLASMLAVTTVAGPAVAPSSQQVPWSKPRVVDPGGGRPTRVSCVSASFCVSVDRHGNAFTFDGSHWSSPRLIDPRSFLMSVSCVTSTFCVAVDDGGRALTFDGQ